MIECLSLKRFLETTNKKHIIFTYGELSVESKGNYFFAKKSNTENIFFSIQHSQNSKNYGTSFGSKNEYSNESFLENTNLSPRPDLFLIHGNQYKKILSEFYPIETVRVIGNLKHKLKSIKIKENKPKIKNKKILLIPFSSNDQSFLMAWYQSANLAKNINKIQY